MIKRRDYGVLRSSAERPKGLLEIGLIASDTKIIRWGMHGTFLEGIMIGVGKVTSSRGEIVRMTYYFGDGRMSIIETGRIEHR